MAVKKNRCAVIGAANIDIGGFPTGLMAARDSNPGHVRMSAGGVGRNIACNLALLGVETWLVAALGGDAFADVIRMDCARAGVHLDAAAVFPEAASSVYLFVADPVGDMAVAVNDMEICQRLTPEALQPRLEMLNRMDGVILDANLPEESIEYLARRLTVPMIADAVSAAKSNRLRPVLGRLHALKPNALEAAALTGLPVGSPREVEMAARALVRGGTRRVFITMGERGVCAADAEETVRLPGLPVRLRNATGAGDAFTAALAWAALQGCGLREQALAGLAAAAIAVEAEETVSPNMSERALRARMANE